MFENSLINECNDLGRSPNCNNSRVVNSDHLGECSNKCYTPFGRPGPMVVKVPVVLADCKIQIDIESDIRLEREAFDVKTIDKHVCITQCHLVPHTNKVFISGHVQKNIQYSTVDCDNNTSISGSILHSTFNIPFKCVTVVKFDKQPIFGEYSKEKSNVLDKSMLCQSNKEESWQHFNNYYEPIFCELDSANILESDIFHRDRRCGEDFSREKCFRDITEKMVVYIRIKLLQNQSVYIGEPECKVDMIEDCNCKCGKHHKAERCGCNNQKQYDLCNDDIEIGCNSEMGVVGRLRGEKCY
ncbi:CsxC family protein [Clostridium algidicarnis]|uniref:CsxC family protein n=1 Tax=Clostridium algidicarnis TaxID=37659 RepID=UPI001C0CD893|nr:hypothetical protein [Clostridium algidicarnis]MBU3210326.1 hypothetical protein [Clostridium algidicarnis]MBU3228298.1 hypothetical protein [Clostridium algidicarnis]MBU3251355.1 hypothetical protein [Clostridium algidicarnis]